MTIEKILFYGIIIVGAALIIGLTFIYYGTERK